MDPLFVVDARHHGKGPVIFAWHPQGTLLATSGSNRMVHIFTCHGQLLHTIKSLPTTSACTALEWDPLGLSLAIAQANSSVVLLWFTRQWKTRAVDVGVKDVTFVSWSKTGDYLALGTGKGTMCIYHRRTNEKAWLSCMWAAGKHKRRINCGAWSYQNQLAYGSDDKQISVTSETGQIQDQVKVKCRPLDVAFGGKQDQDECIVSVNMDGRTILLYNLHDQENALELAFQTRYGKILSYRWFGDGYIMAGFTSGFIVVISTHAHEIGTSACLMFYWSGFLFPCIFLCGFLAIDVSCRSCVLFQAPRDGSPPKRRKAVHTERFDSKRYGVWDSIKPSKPSVRRTCRAVRGKHSTSTAPVQSVACAPFIAAPLYVARPKLCRVVGLK
ncbi:unnamed protein product [Ectocarpus sp. 12 AP-2014]